LGFSDNDVNRCVVLFNKISVHVQKETLEALYADVSEETNMTYNEDMFHCLAFISLCTSHFTIGTRMRFRLGVRIHVPALVLHYETLGIVIEIKFEHSFQGALKQIVDGKYCEVFKDEEIFNPKVEEKVLIGLRVNK
jgi:hypothetical protein